MLKLRAFNNVTKRWRWMDAPLGVPITRVLTIPFNTRGLNDGITAWTYGEGDVLHAVRLIVDTAWDGTTPRADFGKNKNGMLKDFGGTAYRDMTVIDDKETYPGVGLSLDTMGSSLDSLGVYNGGNAYTIDTIPMEKDDTLDIWVSQDGNPGGSDPEASQGVARLIFTISSPIALAI